MKCLPVVIMSTVLMLVTVSQSTLAVSYSGDEDYTGSTDQKKERMSANEIIPWQGLADFKGRLTFDDGPHPKTTPYILTALLRAGIKDAVFFFVGYRMREYPELVRLVVNSGYAIGYHTMYHPNLVDLSQKEINTDIDRFKKTLNGVLGYEYHLKYARPSYGGMTSSTVKKFLRWREDGTLAGLLLGEKHNKAFIDKKILDALEAHKLDTLLWNVQVDDWEEMITPEPVGQYFVPDVPQIWLFHEMPVDARTQRVFDNGIGEAIPDVLMEMRRLVETTDSVQEETRSIDTAQ